MIDLFPIVMFAACLLVVVWICEIRFRQMRDSRDYFKAQTYRLREQRNDLVRRLNGDPTFSPLQDQAQDSATVTRLHSR